MVSIPAVRRFKAAQDAETEIGELNKALRGDGVQATAVAGGPDASIPENIFTDSWIYKSATTPMKRIITNPNIPNDVKLAMLQDEGAEEWKIKNASKGHRKGDNGRAERLDKNYLVKTSRVEKPIDESDGSGLSDPDQSRVDRFFRLFNKKQSTDCCEKLQKR